MNYLSLTAIMQNEGLFLKEWIEFHRLVGVEKFYLYDHESTDNTHDILKPYIDKGIVSYFYTSMKSPLIECYLNSIRNFCSKTYWMIYIDLDEFIFPVKKNSLPEFLKDFENYPSVGAGWLIYGSSHHNERPKGLVTENYTSRAPIGTGEFDPNRHIKSIIKPRSFTYPLTPHHFSPKNVSLPPVDENKAPLSGPFRGKNAEWTFNQIRVNHYCTKSREDWIVKSRNITRFSEEHWKMYDRNDERDCTIHKYLPLLKKKLNDKCISKF